MKIAWILFFSFALALPGIWVIAHVQKKKPAQINLPRDYLIGLNFLLNEETDKAVDIFIKMLEVDSDTVETHLRWANCFAVVVKWIVPFAFIRI